MSTLPLAATAPALASWLDANAEAIDTTQTCASAILPRLGEAGLLRIGVATQAGGSGGTTADAIRAVAAVAAHSLTASFVFWGQRTFIEYLLRSPNHGLRESWLATLLSGETAGATGLSNAMKYLSNLEPLQMNATPLARDERNAATSWSLNGALPWITNLRREGFLAAAAFDRCNGAPPSIFAIPHDAGGVERSDDLDLIALRSSNTAALKLSGTVLDDRWLIAADAPAFIAQVRPAFLGLQCGMSVGLASRALDAVTVSSEAARSAVADETAALAQELDLLSGRLFDGVEHGAFLNAPASLFELRIKLAGLVDAAVRLEVTSAGGRGYLRGQGGTARRTREASFVPIVTPSIVQLKTQLAQHRRAQAA